MGWSRRGEAANCSLEDSRPREHRVKVMPSLSGMGLAPPRSDGQAPAVLPRRERLLIVGYGYQVFSLLRYKTHAGRKRVIPPQVLIRHTFWGPFPFLGRSVVSQGHHIILMHFRNQWVHKRGKLYCGMHVNTRIKRYTPQKQPV